MRRVGSLSGMGRTGGWVLIVRRETQMLNKSVLFLVPFFAQRQMSALAVGVGIGATGTCKKNARGSFKFWRGWFPVASNCEDNTKHADA